jgi:hypothetical protein
LFLVLVSDLGSGTSILYKRKKPCATSLMLLLESLPESNRGERKTAVQLNE